MTITYSLAPNPKWYIADLVGRPLGAGQMFTYSSLNKNVFKNVFQDAAGTIPWTDPILFDENGSQGPFYWEFDSANPLDLYYIRVYDINGVFQWDIDNFDGVSGSGGGGTTTILDITNLVPNNIFWRGRYSANPIVSTTNNLAPGIHSGLAQTASNYGPDIWFYKNNTSATDVITFPNFGVGSNALAPDLTPQNYLNYTCSAPGAGETSKYIQIPICKNVQNFQNTSISMTIWARCNSGFTTLGVYSAQFFGDGASASLPVQHKLQDLNLTNVWAQYTIHAAIPAISTKIIGGGVNDGLFLQLFLPLNASTNIDLIKPCLYLGNVAPTTQFSPIESIESLVNSTRTGFVTAGYSAPLGYLLMDDLTIGNTGSGATSNSGFGADANTFPLYNLLWTLVSSPSSNSLCPVSGGLGGSAIEDFEANKTLKLQSILGRALASAGAGSGLTARTLGSIFGTETHGLSFNELTPHTHTFSISNENIFTGASSSIGVQGTTGITVNSNTTLTGTTDNSGNGAQFNIMQPSTFINYYIKL